VVQKLGPTLRGLGSGTWGRKDACRKILSARLPTESNSALAAAVFTPQRLFQETECNEVHRVSCISAED
jgi:hypothetical protein